AKTWSLGGVNGFEPFTVALHEAGHVFGMDHSADPASALYESYTGPRQGLSGGDIANLRALYGPRLPDDFEGSTGHDTAATATSLGLLSSNSSLALSATADVTTPQDRDWYSFRTPLTLGGGQILLRTTGVSLLTARLSVYDGSGSLMGSAAATDPT